MVKFTPGRFTPRERAPGTHWIGGWLGPRAGLDIVTKRKIPSPCRESNPDHPLGRVLQKLLLKYSRSSLPFMFTRARHWFLYWARCIQSKISHPVSLRSILILSSYLLLSLSSGLFPSGISTTILYALFISSKRATCPPISSFSSWSH
jgi:hypothetical protein